MHSDHQQAENQIDLIHKVQILQMILQGRSILAWHCSLLPWSHPSWELFPPPKPHHSPHSIPPLPQPASLQLLNSLPAGLPLIYALSGLSWIIILYEMFVLYPPPVLKCQEYIPRPSIFNTSARAWQFSDMNIMALHAEPPSLKLTSVRISSLEQGK